MRSEIESANTCAPKIIFFCGLRSRSSSEAGSVASARAVKVSMMMLIQSSWMVDNTEVSEDDATAMINVMLMAVTFVDAKICGLGH